MNPQQNGCLRPEQSSTPRAQVSRVRVFLLASVLAAAPIVTGFPQISAQAEARPVVSKVREVRFAGSSVAVLRASDGAARSTASASGKPDPMTAARAGAVTPVQDVAGAVTVVGVTWPKGAVAATDDFQIRILTGGTWSAWDALDVDQAVGPDRTEATSAASSSNEGTSPYAVTGASKFQVRSLTTGPTAPAEARVQVVDPGESTADSVRPSPGAAAAATAQPFVYPRAAWGADESLRKGVPSYGQVQVGFVHHTDSPNTYAASEVPAMIRGIYAYHIQSQGWSDIGYNFLIDRFGRTWEGRYGGMDKAVTGAQTLNYNSVSMGVSALGNFEATAVPQEMTTAFKRIFAWKFSLSGIPATGTVVANGKSFPRVAGHRDGFQTACPGEFLYARLPEIRNGAAALIGVPAPSPPPAPKPAPTPAPKPAPTPVAPLASARTWYTSYKPVILRQGSRGAAVSFLQRALKIKPDGSFGPGTKAAVMAFQTRHRIARNGIVGPMVWRRLEMRDFPLVAYRYVVLRQGSRGPAVVAVQKKLGLTADGMYGPMTAATVSIVQGRARLVRTGVVSGWTWVAIEKFVRR